MSKRPKPTPFNQQELPSWHPNLTAGNVAPVFIVVAVICLFIGLIVSTITSSTQEIVLDYTFCNSTLNKGKENVSCADIIRYSPNTSTVASCSCKLNFSLNTSFTGPVFLYYALTNFYQNHRLYVQSRDDNQLLGRLEKTVSSTCSPYDYVVGEDGKKTAIAPCGAIANSLFSDEISVSLIKYDSVIKVPLIRTGIAWPSDKYVKFRNPPGDLKEAFKEYAKPVNWKKNIWELDTEIPDNNGFQNEDLIVWMRTAAMPNFRKLYRIVNHAAEPFQTGLPKGNYTVHIDYSFPVAEFKGSKSLVITTASALGSKNPFLGTLYLSCGFICLICGITFYLIRAFYDTKRVLMLDD